MRSIILLFVLAFASFAADAPKFMAHWQTVEPNYGGVYMNAVYCLDGRPDCGMPDMNVDHYDTFASEKEALAFVNDDFQCKVPVTGIMSVMSSDVWTISLQRPAKLNVPVRGKKFVALYSIKEVPVKVTEYTVEKPQPAVVEKHIKIEKP